MKKFLLASIIACLGAVALIAQGSGTPNTLRVLTDANGYLVVESATQTLPLTSSVFSNTRLKTDVDGNLQVVLVGGGSGAPTDATYITQTPNASLTNEQAISGLASGILRGATATGVITSLGDILPSANGGTANAFFTVAGPITSVKTFTFPNASSTVLTSNDTITAAQGGTGISTYAVGDMLFASAITPTLSKLAAVAVGNVLCSAGVNTAPVWCNNPTVTTISIGTTVATTGGIRLQDQVAITARNTANTINIELIRTGGGDDSVLIGNSGAAIIKLNAPLLMYAGKLLIGTAPTIPVACTTPTVTWSSGTAVFQIDVGSSCTGITTLSFTMPSATNGWSCNPKNVSTTSNPEQTAKTTTSVTITNFSRTTGSALDWTDGADVLIDCWGG